ncbi:TlpA disulfide reductase family protein [Desertivirga brevis]|uniref:TlpA disulfide reductase family protein n=1 Tax=Desertivirga brevis TaxID=2810310 RepID=UPI001A9670C2|nr:TlpA disulfide reductase family protein [Pedobacter sp. SYSU D00873]
MKPIITLTFMLLSMLAKAQKQYWIEGFVQGLEDGTPITLNEDDGNLLKPIASDTVRAGVFKFRGTVDQVTKLILLGRGPGFPSQWLELWAGPGITIKISGNNKLLRTWTVESPLKEQKEASLFTKASMLQLDQLQELSIKRNILYNKGIPSDENEKQKFKRSADSIIRMEDSLSNLVCLKDIKILQTLPVTTIWIDKLHGVAMTARYQNNALRRPAIELYKRLSPNQKQTDKGYEIEAYLFPPKVVKNGEPMADTIFSNLAGQKRSLSDYKGKYLVLDFWSMGCGPCIAAMPELKEVSEKYKDKLTVVSLSVDVKKANWQKASEQHKVSWENLNDGKGMAGIAARYGVNGIPHYVMISPEGTVLGSWVGYGEGQLEEKIKTYIK